MEGELFGKYQGWLAVFIIAREYKVEGHCGIAYIYLGLESAVLMGGHFKLKRHRLVFTYKKRNCIILDLVRIG